MGEIGKSWDQVGDNSGAVSVGKVLRTAVDGVILWLLLISV